MTEEEKNISRNKKIILIAEIVLLIIPIVILVAKSTGSAPVHFNQVTNGNTGEPIGVIGSIFLHLLTWGLVGGLLSCVMCLVVELIYTFLHIKDKNTWARFNPPKHEEELFYGFGISFFTSYVATFVVMILIVFNFISF